MTAPRRILPGATLGIVGSGQLGRMLAASARALGYRIYVFSPESDSPAGQAADLEQIGSYNDLDAIRQFAARTQLVTFEFENIPAAALEAAAERAPVRPAASVLRLTQNRLREKSFLRENGFPVAPFRAIRTARELEEAIDQIGAPGVLKTADFGYDGKGQAAIRSADDGSAAARVWRGGTAIYERHVDFEKELSVVAARAVEGEFRAFPVFENRHANHVLDVTLAPARIAPQAAAQAVELARGILEALQVVGVLTVELFLDRRANLLVNELAPRVHNSGHLTLEAAVTSQFEQQVRAVCGLPLGSVHFFRPAAMANLLGECWEEGEPRWAEALRDPDVKLHLYGKSAPRPGRKMGHLTATAPSVEEALRKATGARARLRPSKLAR